MPTPSISSPPSPPDTLGLFDDLWFRWVIDFGAPGPDRGLGGKYLLLPPGYDGPLPEGGYFIGRPTTTSVALLGRAFLVNNDPKPAVETIKKTLKFYPYVPGSYGTSIGSFLTGKAPLAALSEPPTPKFIEGTGLAMNTIPPNDFSYYEMLDALVQEQPAKALAPEIGGQFAAIGIVKGKTFNPDARMRKILTDAIAIANGASRTVVSARASQRGSATTVRSRSGSTRCSSAATTSPGLRLKSLRRASSRFPIPGRERSMPAPPSSTSPPG